MKVTIDKNEVFIDIRDPAAEYFVNTTLVSYEKVKERDRFSGKFNTVSYKRELYKRLISREIVFPRGLLQLVSNFFNNSVQVNDISKYKISHPDMSSYDTKSVLSEFDLRDDQVMAVNKCILNKRGIIQMPTGSGKTAIITAILKILSEHNDDLKALVIAPTVVTIDNLYESLLNNGLESDCSKFSESKNFYSKITISHTTSFSKLIESDPDIFETINVLIYDEAHHSSCDTWIKLNRALKNIEYSLGFSALAIDPKRVFETNIKRYEYDELLVIGSTGPVIMQADAGYYINKGILATPVLLRVESKVSDINDSYLLNTNDWHYINDKYLRSNKRSVDVSFITNVFNQLSMRTLILVSTKQQAWDISKVLLQYYSIDDIIVSFGSKEGYIVKGSIDDKSKIKNALEEFDNGDHKVIIATTHLDEGADLNKLDVLVLASGGKKVRRIIQRVGRALRKSKSGKYAYIIDFTDDGNKVLESQSKSRLKIYEENLSIPEKFLYKKVNINDVSSIVMSLER